MGKAQELDERLDVPTQTYQVKGMDVDFAQLNVKHLEEVDKRLDNHDIWKLLTSLFSEEMMEAIEEAEEEGKLEELREKGLEDTASDVLDRKAMMGLVEELDYEVQFNVAWESLKMGWDPQVTGDQAANVFSFGLSDDEQLGVVMFCLQGPGPEQIEEKVEEEGKKAKNSDSEGEQLALEE